MSSAPIVHRTDHVGCSVTSLDAALRFWTEALGAKLMRTFDMGGRSLGEVTGAHGATVRAAIVELAGLAIELLEYSGAPARRGPVPAPFDAGTLHLGLLVDDLDGLLARIAPFGWHPQGEPQAIAAGPRKGTRVIYVVGPDGETLELMQPPLSP